MSAEARGVHADPLILQNPITERKAGYSTGKKAVKRRKQRARKAAEAATLEGQAKAKAKIEDLAEEDNNTVLPESIS